MLDWIKNLYYQAFVGVPSQVAHWVLDQLKHVVAWLENVLGSHKSRWGDIWQSARSLASGVDALGRETYWMLWRIRRQQVPGVVAWAGRRFTADEHTGAARYTYLRQLIQRNYNTEKSDLSSFKRWLLLLVVAPILWTLKTIGEQMIKWAFFAYQLLTAPLKLANILFWALISVLEANFWEVAAKFGEYVARLVWANMPKTLQIIEQIITDTL